VWHWTAGPARGSAFARALAESIRSFNRATDRAASWHVLLAKDGRIFQSIPFDRGSWHVGRPGRIGGKPVRLLADGNGPVWDATAWTGRLFANINQATVGIELENSGRLLEQNGRFYCWPFWHDPDHPDTGVDPTLEIPSDRAVLIGDTWYDDFPQPQRDMATKVLRALVQRYAWSRDVAQYGHLMFDPARKEDPGPAWLGRYLPDILDRVFGGEPVEPPLPVG
jgi:N-acetyl-anhydromuramyl-L-alanine amidase AmpD